MKANEIRNLTNKEEKWYYDEASNSLKPESHFKNYHNIDPVKDFSLTEYHGIVLRVALTNIDNLADLINIRKNEGKYHNYMYIFATLEDFQNHERYKWTVTPIKKFMQITSVEQLKKMGDKYYFEV